MKTLNQILTSCKNQGCPPYGSRVELCTIQIVYCVLEGSIACKTEKIGKVHLNWGTIISSSLNENPSGYSLIT